MPPKFALQPRAVPRQSTQIRPINRQRLTSVGPPVFRASSVTPSPQPGLPPKRARLAKAQCPNPTCSNPRIEETEDGNLICANCQAMVEEDSQLVSDQQFDEGANGRIVAQGTRVALDQTHQKTYGAGAPGKEPTPSRQKAEQVAKRKIASLAANLHIHDPDQASAMRIFGIAYGNFFYRGRTIEDVALVCLYLAVRKATIQEGGKKRPKYTLMLIDFADEEQMNVFALGRMYTDLVQTIYIDDTWKDGRLKDNVELLAHGPEVLVDRFVDELDFDTPDKPKIKRDAIKIVQRMSRDWMHYGRRPSGLCGAAVILAARMNNYRRTTREVVLVAKVCEVTINNRLEEFKETESSNLSVEQFRDEAILEAIPSANPPVFDKFWNPKEKSKKKRGRKRKNPTPDTTENDQIGQDTENASENLVINTTLSDGGPASKRPRIDAEGFAIPALPQRSQQPDNTEASGESSPEDALSPETDQTDEDQQSTTSESSSTPRKRRPRWRAGPATADELALEARIQHDLDEALEENERTIRASLTPAPESSTALDTPDPPPHAGDPISVSTEVFPTPPSTQVQQSQPLNNESTHSNSDAVLPTPPATQIPVQTRTQPASPSRTSTQPRPQPTPPSPSVTLPTPTRSRPDKTPGPAVNTDIGNLGQVSMSPTIQAHEFDSDPDVSTCLLTEPEVHLKETVWVTENADWLRQSHAKQIRKQLRDAELRAQGLDPDVDGKGGNKGILRRKDGMRRAGRMGDVRYLDDMRRKKGGKAGGKDGEDAGVGGGGANGDEEGSVISAADSVTAMLQTRGYASRRIDYQAAAIRLIYAMDEDSSETNGVETPDEAAASPATAMSPGRTAGTASPKTPVGRAGSPSTKTGVRRPSTTIFRPWGGRASTGGRSKASLAAEGREARKREKRVAEKMKKRQSGSLTGTRSEADSIADREGSEATSVGEDEAGPSDAAQRQARVVKEGVPVVKTTTTHTSQENEGDVGAQIPGTRASKPIEITETARTAVPNEEGEGEDDEDEDDDDVEDEPEEAGEDDIDGAFAGTWKKPEGWDEGEERVEDE